MIAITPRMIRQFGRAYAKWMQAGQPVRTQEEIDQIFETHCRSCEHFKPLKHRPGRGHCRLCGCRCKNKRKFMNKLAWRTEQCPADPPKWT
jgi:hypothetical protein